MAQFVLVNVVVAVLMKHLDVKKRKSVIYRLNEYFYIWNDLFEKESNKMMADDAADDEEIERQLEAEARNNIYEDQTLKMENDVI